jgi:membrane protease YdiL (CAAX protease family)
MAEPNVGLPDPVLVAPLPPSPPKHTIFQGPNGIRAGWRVLLFLAIIAAEYVLLAVILRLFLFGNRPAQVSTVGPTGLFLLEGTIFLFTSVAALIMARVERRHYGDYGLPLRPAFRKNFWVGTAAGFLAISGTLFCIFLFHGFRLVGLATHGSTLVSATLVWTAVFIVVGLSEEFAFRGYLQFTLTTGMGFWPSAFLLSALFGFAHAGNPGESKFGLVSVVFFGLLFCLFLRRTGNLWWAVGFHAGWDWGQTFFYGVADSGIPPYHNLFNSEFAGRTWITGGSVGPEASIFTPIVLAIVAILFSCVCGQNRQIGRVN